MRLAFHCSQIYLYSFNTQYVSCICCAAETTEKHPSKPEAKKQIWWNNKSAKGEPVILNYIKFICCNTESESNAITKNESSEKRIRVVEREQRQNADVCVYWRSVVAHQHIAAFRVIINTDGQKAKENENRLQADSWYN